MNKGDLLQSLKTQPKDVAIVDLRNEQEKGFITQSVHIPATVVDGPQDIKELFLDPVLEKFPDAKTVVIHCNLSGRRATLIGGWAKDHLANYGPHDVKVEILHEGIVGWLNEDPDYKSETTFVTAA